MFQKLVTIHPSSHEEYPSMSSFVVRASAIAKNAHSLRIILFFNQHCYYDRSYDLLFYGMMCVRLLFSR